MKLTRKDFSIEDLASGWAVVRRDGFLVAIGFASKRDATEWWVREARMAGL